MRGMIFQARFLRASLFFLGSGAILFIFLSKGHWTSLRLSQQAWENFDSVQNETLGVQNIFAINLPERLDKRDNIALGSAVCNFRVDWIDGVRPQDVSPKIYPYNWNNQGGPSEFASRRAHINVMARIVEQRINSAIIMEDDVDWDVSIKAQLKSFARAIRTLQGAKGPSQGSPYGDEWDILWLGHCGIECKTNLPYYLIPEDPTIPAPRHFLPYLRDSPPMERPDHTRLICTADDGVCSSFYAVSYRGALKILAALSVNPLGLAEEIDIGAQFDVSLGRMCRHGYIRCFSVYPAITGAFRSAGAPSKGSDIHEAGGDPVGFASWGVLYSTMMNINRLIKGDHSVRSNWEDVDFPEIVPDKINIGNGFVLPPVDKETK